MPILADDEWHVLSQDDPRWHFLVRLDPACAALPGTWQVRGSEDIALQPEDVFQLEAENLAAQLQQIETPALFRFGDVEVRYLPPARPARAGFQRWWGLAGGLIIKFKALVVFGSVVLSLLVYGEIFGWVYGIGLVAIIAIHEFGHVVANRRKGIPASLPIFIPLLGAFIQLKQSPKNAADEAYIGIMGPLFGLGATLLSLVLGILTRLSLFYAVAEVGFLLHVFNLMPVLPLDGGRTVGFWQWKAWIPGIVGALVVLFYNPLKNQFTLDPVTIVIVVLIVLSLVREPRRRTQSYTAIPGQSRMFYTVLWALAFAISVAGYWGLGHLHHFL